jgi:hypothetical protein
MEPPNNHTRDFTSHVEWGAAVTGGSPSKNRA